MSHRFESLFEAHPGLAWLASGVSWLLSLCSWMVDHADDGAKVFGVFAAIFATVAGYYTMRIQRRAWNRGKRPPPLD